MMSVLARMKKKKRTSLFPRKNLVTVVICTLIKVEEKPLGLGVGSAFTRAVGEGLTWRGARAKQPDFLRMRLTFCTLCFAVAAGSINMHACYSSEQMSCCIF